MSHRCRLQVRTYECDSYDHVNNAVYLNYLEFARLEFLKSEGIDYFAWRKKGYGVVISEVQIKYKMMALADDWLEIETKSVEAGAVSGMVNQRILRGEDLIAEALVRWVFIGPEGRPTRLPPELRNSGFYKIDA